MLVASALLRWCPAPAGRRLSTLPWQGLVSTALVRKPPCSSLVAFGTMMTAMGFGASTYSAALRCDSAQSPWAAHTDPGSGKMYYYNSLTGQTTWEKPPAMLQAERDAAAKAQAEAQAATRVEAATRAAAAAAAADPWDAHVDPSSGKTFYVNRLTQQTVRVLSHEPLLTVYATENNVSIRAVVGEAGCRGTTTDHFRANSQRQLRACPPFEKVWRVYCDEYCCWVFRHLLLHPNHLPPVARLSVLWWIGVLGTLPVQRSQGKRAQAPGRRAACGWRAGTVHADRHWRCHSGQYGRCLAEWPRRFDTYVLLHAMLHGRGRAPGPMHLPIDPSRDHPTQHPLLVGHGWRPNPDGAYPRHPLCGRRLCRRDPSRAWLQERQISVPSADGVGEGVPRIAA